MIVCKVGGVYADSNTRAAVAMVLAEVQNDAAFGYLPVQRGVVVEAMLPVGFEAEVVEVEFVGFGDVKDAEDGGDGVEFWGHCDEAEVC